MKSFENTMIVVSLLGLCFFFGFDTRVAHADFTFGEPVQSAPIGTVRDGADCLSYDELEMYFTSFISNLPGGQGGYDLWVLRRASKDDLWDPAENLGSGVNSPYNDCLASISADGLTLYFSSDRPYGDDVRYDIYVATRADQNAPWGQAVKMGLAINGAGTTEFGVWISPDDLELYVNSLFRSDGYGSFDIYVAKRVNVNAPWGDAVNLGSGVNSEYMESVCSLSPDGQLLLFSEHFTGGGRPSSYGPSGFWMARRGNLSDSWEAPVDLGPRINSPSTDVQGRISPDGRTLYFLSQRSGAWKSWQAPIIPIADFNGDSKIDGADVCTMIDHWGTGDPVCDIGPMPWGDGVVDFEDLRVLTEFIGEPVDDPTLIAHWPLDETDGDTAWDSAGAKDGTLLGNPIWRSDEGMVNGTLEFDGVDDSIVVNGHIAGFNPADGPFSVVAWVQGGAPGQVIVSQMGMGGQNWLGIEPTDGSLMTEMQGTGRDGCALCSQEVINDANWHRIGLAWDGMNRRLYVDGVVVAEDTQAGRLGNCFGGLNIGCGTDMAPGTFFSGLIDDVRIYNRAVKP